MWDYKQVSTDPLGTSRALVLVLLAIAAITIRCGGLASLQDRYVLDGDSYRFLRIAEADLAGRPITGRDMMRWTPEGRDMSTYLGLHSIVMSRLFKFARHVGYRPPFRRFAIRYPILCFLLSIWILYLLLARYVAPLAGMVAAAGLAIGPATVYRSSAGVVDRDPFCLLLIVCAYAAYAASVAERAARVRLGAALLCGVFSALLCLTWEGGGLFTAAFAVILAWTAMSGELTADMLAGQALWCATALPPLLLCTHAYRQIEKPRADLNKAMREVQVGTRTSKL